MPLFLISVGRRRRSTEKTEPATKDILMLTEYVAPLCLKLFILESRYTVLSKDSFKS